MGLINRTSRVIRSNITAWGTTSTYESLEYHTNSDVKQTLIELCQATQRATETEWQIQRQIDRAYATAMTWQLQAEVALQLVDERSARDALLHKRAQFTLIDCLEEKLEEQTSLLHLLGQSLDSLEEKFPNLARQVEVYFFARQGQDRSF